MTLLGPRRHRRERLDAPRLDREELAGSLAHVSAVNRWLGGDRGLRRHLDVLARELDVPPRLLDVGTGDGTHLLRMRRSLEGGGRVPTAVGVDIHADTVRVARQRIRDDRGVEVIRADGLRLPFATSSFDAVLSSLTLHHFRDDGAATLLREMARVGRHRVLASDLERHVLNYLGAAILARTWWRANPLTRHDGPLSVLRSFTPRELEALGRRAGLRDVRVVRHFPFRLVLEGRP